MLAQYRGWIFGDNLKTPRWIWVLSGTPTLKPDIYPPYDSRWRLAGAKRMEDKDVGYIHKPMIDKDIVLDDKVRLQTMAELHKLGQEAEMAFLENKRAREEAEKSAEVGKGREEEEEVEGNKTSSQSEGLRGEGTGETRFSKAREEGDSQGAFKRKMSDTETSTGGIASHDTKRSHTSKREEEASMSQGQVHGSGTREEGQGEAKAQSEGMDITPSEAEDSSSSSSDQHTRPGSPSAGNSPSGRAQMDSGENVMANPSNDSKEDMDSGEDVRMSQDSGEDSREDTGEDTKGEEWEDAEEEEEPEEELETLAQWIRTVHKLKWERHVECELRLAHHKHLRNLKQATSAGDDITSTNKFEWLRKELEVNEFYASQYAWKAHPNSNDILVHNGNYAKQFIWPKTYQPQGLKRERGHMVTDPSCPKFSKQTKERKLLPNMLVEVEDAPGIWFVADSSYDGWVFDDNLDELDWVWHFGDQNPSVKKPDVFPPADSRWQKKATGKVRCNPTKINTNPITDSRVIREEKAREDLLWDLDTIREQIEQEFNKEPSAFKEALKQAEQVDLQTYKRRDKAQADNKRQLQEDAGASEKGTGPKRRKSGESTKYAEKKRARDQGTVDKDKTIPTINDNLRDLRPEARKTGKNQRRKEINNERVEVEVKSDRALLEKEAAVFLSQTEKLKKWNKEYASEFSSIAQIARGEAPRVIEAARSARRTLRNIRPLITARYVSKAKEWQITTDVAFKIPHFIEGANVIKVLERKVTIESPLDLFEIVPIEEDQNAHDSHEGSVIPLKSSKEVSRNSPRAFSPLIAKMPESTQLRPRMIWKPWRTMTEVPYNILADTGISAELLASAMALMVSIGLVEGDEDLESKAFVIDSERFYRSDASDAGSWDGDDEQDGLNQHQELEKGSSDQIELGGADTEGDLVLSPLTGSGPEIVQEALDSDTDKGDPHT
ncbi:hypothetical protein CBR_g18910 [Chara braunii]|uniref:Uncharacterized protein n=1 Tax=Chara braunii TaxID=69332 RepID=A0A388KWQ2_CHABU|nr:hypothetical protein CBR_g18910 [Chara braunii]|eukprot:GBG74500.1 hypothetical protein CBR_g18910 [Chara braunii]